MRVDCFGLFVWTRDSVCLCVVRECGSGLFSLFCADITLSLVMGDVYGQFPFICDNNTPCLCSVIRYVAGVCFSLVCMDNTLCNSVVGWRGEGEVGGWYTV